MDGQRLGAVVRAVRLRRRWRQVDVALAAGVTDSTVSRIERGHLDRLTVRTVVSVAAALDVRLDWTPRWRGGELDRMLNAGHAALHEAAVRLLMTSGWVSAPEATFAIYGERGAIDILAHHPDASALLVVELKTQLVDIQGLIGAVDRYRRLAPRLAADRGWQVRSVSAWVALTDSGTNRRRVAQHASVLRAAFPADGRRMRSWLLQPIEPVRALSFLSDSHVRTASTSSSAAQRVRVRAREPN
jgi:transcriptional regulator with XRE-family HTH domain